MNKFLTVFLFFIISIFFTPNDSIKAQGKFKIMLDAGHGGRDPGSIGTRRYIKTEKDIVLKVSLNVGKRIKKKFPNIKVFYTRTKDKFVTLQRRSQMANEEKVNLFLSIHCNSNHRSTPFGSETYVMGLHKTKSNFEIAKKENSVIFLEENYKERYEGFDPNSPESYIGFSLYQNENLEQSLLLAKYIEEEFEKAAKRNSRGVKQAGFWVISKNIMPSILIELGFLSNKKEEDFLHSKIGQDKMSVAIVSAIGRYYNAWKKSQISGLSKENKSDEYNSNISEKTQYHIQIFASKHYYKKNNPIFKGLIGIDYIKKGNIYKYTTGATYNYNNAKRILNKVRKKGFKDAFIISINRGKVVPLPKK